MARETIVRLTDDLDGTEADETVVFGLRGVEYEIDLNAKNAAGLEKALGKYVEAARRSSSGRGRGRTGGRRRPGNGRSDVASIRSWARDNGFEVSDRGRIPTEVRDAFEAAHG